MTGSKKIKTLTEIKSEITPLRPERKISLTYGHFSVIHPGHLRYLQFAKSKGDFLVVAIQKLGKDNEHFSQQERAEAISNLAIVDRVILLDENITSAIKEIKPDFYVKGKEFENNTELFIDEIKAVEEAGGKVVYSSGEVKYATSRIGKGQKNILSPEKAKAFLKTCKRQNIDFLKLKKKIEEFNKLKILVIGDTIVDQFVACDSLGISSEAPVQVVRELDAQEFIGGAAIIALHLKKLGASAHFFSVLGNDSSSNYVQKMLDKAGIESLLYRDESRPTTFKIRYMVNNQKLLRVSRLKQHSLSREIENIYLEELRKVIPTMDGIIISDFAYGMLTSRIIEEITELSKACKVNIYADAQSSSQIGDIAKYKGISLSTPTEKEIRIALSDQESGIEELAHRFLNETQNNYLTVTLGSQGVLAYSGAPNTESIDSEYFCALSDSAVDVAGAGDAFLSGASLALSSGLNVMEASAIGSIMSAISIKRVGNISISKEDIINYINLLLENDGSDMNYLKYV
ncbi:MAG: rfaE bifunctional protein kinase chain/domain [Bacteriovoracaceae bacterium]|jgi:rfaE bifunctional protein kinase chain/domain